jgi:hypothetical protein
VNGKEEKLTRIATPSNNFFGSITVVNVDIDNGTTIAEKTIIGDRVQCTSSDIIEYTETARLSSF